MAKDLFVSALLDVYGEFLSEKQKRVTEHYYNDDLSLSEIAENEGITRQGVNDLIKRSEAQLYSWEEKCHYCKSFLRLKELAETGIVSENSSELLEIIDNL
ncbi:MAG: DNA-binding protein [Clostridia bacterium]|nr:DNA-binding protein [Clostridia bacterium]